MSYSEFIEFFKFQLTDDTTLISLETVFRDLPDWDSLTAMMLITNLKDDHAINMSVSELQSCNTVGDIFTLINTK